MEYALLTIIEYYTELNVEMEPHLQVKWSRLQEKVILIKARHLGYLKSSNFNKVLPLIWTLTILYIVSYSRGDIPLLLDLRPNLFQHATTSQPSRAPEPTKSNLRPQVKTFPEGAYLHVVHMINSFPSLTLYPVWSLMYIILLSCTE